MFYPNGNSTINKLKEYLNKDLYILYAEEVVEEPKDWDWKKQGFYHGKRTQINTLEELQKYAFDKNYTICVDETENFYKNHCFEGQEYLSTKSFHWEYNGGTDRYYKIVESKTFDNNETYLELVKCNRDCSYTIGWWILEDECWEFHSVGSRFFNDIHEDDYLIIYKAMKKADKYLNGENYE